MRSRFVIVLLLAGYAIFTAASFSSLMPVVPITALACLQICRIETEAFTASDAFWLCTLVFFGIAPAQGYIEEHFPFSGSTRGVQFPYTLYLQSCFMLFIVFAGAAVGEILVRSRAQVPLSDTHQRQPLKTPDQLILLPVVGSVALLLHIAFEGGLANVLASRLNKSLEGSHFIATLFLAIGAAVNAVLAASYAQHRRISPVALAVVCVCVLLQLLAVNIYNSPRFFIIATWVPFFLALVPAIRSAKLVYASALLAMLVVMPALSVTTRYGGLSSDIADEYAVEAPFYFIQNVDIFEMVAQSIDHVARVGHYGGDNLSAILLFFVPRSYWVAKPLVGGLLVGEELLAGGSTGTANLSFFVGSDLYLDFGWFGILLSAVLFGLFSNWLVRRRLAVGNVDLISICLLASIPILLRGPLGAVLGYPLCLLVSLGVVLSIASSAKSTDGNHP